MCILYSNRLVSYNIGLILYINGVISSNNALFSYNNGHILYNCRCQDVLIGSIAIEASHLNIIRDAYCITSAGHIMIGVFNIPSGQSCIICCYRCSVHLPNGTVSRSACCDCGIS